MLMQTFISYGMYFIQNQIEAYNNYTALDKHIAKHELKIIK